MIFRTSLSSTKRCVGSVGEGMKSNFKVEYWHRSKTAAIARVLTPLRVPASVAADTGAQAGDVESAHDLEVRFGGATGLTHVMPSRAVSRSRSGEKAPACHAIGTTWREAEAFGEVQQATHTAGVVVEHDRHRTRGVFRAREWEQMIGAEVERRFRKRKEREQKSSRSPRQRRCGLAGGLLRAGYRHSAAHDRSQLTRPADRDFYWPCADYRRPAGRSRSSRRGGRQWRSRWSY
jgi:hypothetical protein